MARARHLKNAPVREALIDIQFEPRIEIASIERFANDQRPEFPKQLDLWEALVGFNVDGTEASANATQAIIGKRLDSDDGLHVLQCRTGGFTFSRLSPYIEWNQLREDARRLWETFCREAGPQEVKRLAVRYINEIRIPLPIRDFGDYFVCPPRVPDALPQAMSGFMQRVVIPDDASNSVSVVNQLFERQPVMSGGQEAITVVLDIDVFCQAAIEPSNVDQIWGALDGLREQKNRIFFEYLTERSVEMFE